MARGADHQERPPRRPSARILAGLFAHELVRALPPEDVAESSEPCPQEAVSAADAS